MIPRISKGGSARAALAYDYGPGKREEHVNPRTVAGNLPGDWRDQAAVMDGHAKLTRPEVEQHVWRSSLRAAEQDRTLTDAEWGQAAETYVKHMGFDDAPWTATRHGDDHIHLTVSRVRWDGKLTDLNQDYARAQGAARAVERDYDLVDASTRYDRARPQVSHGERESAERRGVQPERDQLRERVDAATARSGGTLDGFDRELAERGVVHKRNQASTGRVSGYSYGLAGHTDQTGEQVWFKGSALGKDYRWATTQDRITHSRSQTDRSDGGPEPLAARSPSQENAPRPADQKGIEMDEQARPVGESGPQQEATSPQQEPRTEGPPDSAAERTRSIMERLRGQEQDRDQGQER